MKKKQKSGFLRGQTQETQAATTGFFVTQQHYNSWQENCSAVLEQQCGDTAGNWDVVKNMLEVREADQTDCDILLSWRNDEQTRTMSRTSDPISATEHKKWFDAALENPLRQLLMIVRHDAQGTQFIGTTRFDTEPSDGTVEVSVTLNPEVRGQGYSKTVLSSSIAYVDKNRKPTRYIAVIKPGNTASVRAFASVGFKRCGEKSGLDIYELTRP